MQSFHITMSAVTNDACIRQTDGQTELRTLTKTALCIASRGKNENMSRYNSVENILLTSL